MPGDLERGRQKVEWARRHMAVLGAVRTRFEQEQPFKGLTISCVLHVEAKTAGTGPRAPGGRGYRPHGRRQPALDRR